MSRVLGDDAGGFSTHDASVGYFNSVPIEAVLTPFQVVSALNFATHFHAWGLVQKYTLSGIS